MGCYLHTGKRSECTGCAACAQSCPANAISMEEDEEGFFYPVISEEKCIKCGMCEKICPTAKPVIKNYPKAAFGGYNTDNEIRLQSTSGGAFSAIVDAFCDENYVVFGAKADKLSVHHCYITDKKQVYVFRRSKYSQSSIGESFLQAKQFLEEGKKVLFSGTPCQIAGLKAYLKNSDQHENLLTVEVVCEGVPTPHFVRRYEEYLKERFGAGISELDYRYKDKKRGRWDYQMMFTRLTNGKTLTKDRWFNPFWSIWLSHLMSRPSCYECPYTTSERTADITLGDLWGVHLYCPELYGKNGGASLIVCNTEKGVGILKKAKKSMFGHELLFEDALRYQGPMRKHIEMNPSREEFMTDVKGKKYTELCRKWAKKPTLKLLVSKYVWGTNRQKCRRYNK